MNFNIPIGTVPPRTKVEIEAAISDGEMVSRNHLGFICLDCGYATYDCDKMIWHQQHQAEIHTLWQRLHRWFDSSKKPRRIDPCG